MSTDYALRKLRAADPAQKLAPLSTHTRDELRDAITAKTAPAHRDAKVKRTRARRPINVIAIAAIALVLGVGAAWATGVVTPLSIFQNNPQQRDAARGSLWDQRVIPSSVVDAASVDIPQVGAVHFFYGRSAQGGWCGALQLPSKAWVGTGTDSHDAGGTVPGCFPSREAINKSGPVYVLNGFDFQEGLVDARPDGGAFWRIRYGLVTIPSAVRVTDTVSGRSAPVAHGDLFMLAAPDATPQGATVFHIVAYDSAGKVVGQG